MIIKKIEKPFDKDLADNVESGAMGCSVFFPMGNTKQDVVALIIR
jgi:hypothetical protein